MVNLKLEKQRLQCSALSTAPSKTLKCFLLTATTVSMLKGYLKFQKTGLMKLLNESFLVKPKDFKEQTALIDQIQDYYHQCGINHIRHFHFAVWRKSLLKHQVNPKHLAVNRELNRQLAILAQTTKIKKIPVIITSQVRSVFNDQSTSVRPVATRVLKFWADTHNRPQTYQ